MGVQASTDVTFQTSDTVSSDLSLKDEDRVREVVEIIPSIPVDFHKPLSSLISGSLIENHKYELWDKIILNKPTIPDAETVLKILKDIDLDIVSSIKLDGILRGDVHYIIPVICGIRSPQTLQHLVNAIYRVAFRFCDDGVYGTAGITNLEGCDRVLVWIKAILQGMILAPHTYSSVKTLLSDKLCIDVLSSVETLDINTTFMSAPLTKIRNGWDQYVKTPALSAFLISMINVLGFARNYSIPSTWVEAFPDEQILHYNVADEARCWAYGVGCKDLGKDEKEVVKKEIRTTDVTPDMWNRRSTILELLILTVSDGFQSTITNWGFEGIEYPKLNNDSENNIECIDVPCFLSALAGGSVVLTATLAVSIMGMIEFGNYSKVERGWFGRSSVHPSPIEVPQLKRCFELSISLWSPLISLNHNIVSPKRGGRTPSDYRNRNIFPSLMANVGEMIVITDGASERSEGRLAQIVRSLALQFQTSTLTYLKSNKSSDYNSCIESVLVLYNFSTIPSYEIAFTWVPEINADIMLTCVELITRQLDNRKESSDVSQIDDGLILLLQTLWKLSAFGRDLKWQMILKQEFRSTNFWRVFESSDVFKQSIANIRRYKLTVGDALVLFCIDKMNELAFKWSGGCRISQYVIEQLSTILHNVSINIHEISFFIADHIFGILEKWTKSSVILNRRKAPAIVEILLRRIECFLAISRNHDKNNCPPRNSRFRNPYILYYLLRHVDRINQLIGVSIPKGTKVLNFTNERELVRWRDTLKPLRFINEFLAKAGNEIVLREDFVDMVDINTVLKIIDEDYWRLLLPLLRENIKPREYSRSPSGDFWVFTLFSEILPSKYNELILGGGNDTTPLANSRRKSQKEFSSSLSVHLDPEESSADECVKEAPKDASKVTKKTESENIVTAGVIARDSTINAKPPIIN